MKSIFSIQSGVIYVNIVSKQLVNLFHSAGHTLNYHDVLKVDTGLAEKSLESLDVNTGCFVPHNLKDKVVTHFTAVPIPRCQAAICVA
jgi:hypothetical protein